MHELTQQIWLERGVRMNVAYTPISAIGIARHHAGRVYHWLGDTCARDTGIPQPPVGSQMALSACLYTLFLLQ